MKNILQLIIVLFACNFIITCKKDPITNPPPVIPPVIITHDSVTRLSKLFFIDTEASPTDTLRYGEYLYDSLQRVIKVNWYFYDNSSPVLETTLTYHYNGSDSMAYKMTFISNDPLYPNLNTSFFSYDNFLRLIRDSTVYDSGLAVHTYQYSNTMVVAIRKHTFTNPAYHSQEQVDTGFIGSTGEVIKVHQWSSENNNKYYVDSFTYDDKPNPYYQLNIRSTYLPVAGAGRYQDRILQKHNSVVGSSTDPVDSSLIAKVNHNYTYTSLGFPNTEDISDLTPFFRGRLVFIYKKI